MKIGWLSFDKSVICFSAVLYTALLVSSCAKLPRVVKAGEERDGDFAYYALPRTVIVISARGVVTTIEENPMCKNEEALIDDLGLVVPEHPGRFFSVLDVTIDKHIEADPDAIYAVDFTSRGTKEVGLDLDSRGIPSTAKAAATETIFPSMVKATKLTAKIAGKMLFGSPELRETSAACEQAAASLSRIRDRILDLHSSPGAHDSKEILDYKETKLLYAAKQLEALFTGVNIGDPMPVVCEIRPKTDQKEYDLFEWNRDGIENAKASCDYPDDMKIDASNVKPGSTNAGLPVREQHLIRLIVNPLDHTLAAKVKPTTKATERSFHYRLPGYAKVHVEEIVKSADSPSKRSKLTDRYEWPIAKLGQILSVPRLRSSGTVSLVTTFDPDTGALIGLGVKRKQMDVGGAVTELKNPAGSLITSANASKNKDKEQFDDQREQAISNAKVAIRAAEQTVSEAGGS